MQTIHATDVRKDWGGFIDSVIREKPKVIKRSRDRIVALSFEMLKEILVCNKLNVLLLTEDDGSITAVIDDLDLLANAPNEEAALQELAQDAVEYANEYYDDFSYWHTAPNRRKHLVYVLAILACNPQNVAMELFICQAGRN